MHEEQLKGQELELNKLTEQEVQKRAAELAKLRSILFYQQQKAKRQKKIKSKSYHRMLKKQKERNKLPIEELMNLDPEAARYIHRFTIY